MAVLCCAFLFYPSARAQTTSSLFTIATDQTAPGLGLSNKFGQPVNSGVGGTGAYAFIGDGYGALFYRPAGASTALRALQYGDPVPGISGSQVEAFIDSLGPNSQGIVVFTVAYSLGDALRHQAILTYNGTAFQTVATSDQVAPGTGGKTYGVPMRFVGINDNSDVAFITPLTSFLVGIGIPQRTLFVAPAAGSPVRIAGDGDTAPGPQGGTIINLTGDFFFAARRSQVNSHGQVLFRANVLVGGVQSEAFFLGSATASLQAVVVGGNPQPGGGTFSNFFLNEWFLNDLGEVAFINFGSTSTTIWTWTSSSGLVLAPLSGLPVPAPAGVTGSAGTTFGPSFLDGLDNTGAVLFTSAITGTGAFTDFALLRFHPSGATLDVVAYDHEPAPGMSGKTFSSGIGTGIGIGTGLSVSPATNGVVSFFVSFNEGGFALYQQSGAAIPLLLVAAGQVAPPSIGGTFSTTSGGIVGVQTLSGGSTYFIASLVGGAASYGEFLATVSGANVSISTLMTTADTLPSGSRAQLGEEPFAGPFLAGHFAGFTAQLAGGAPSLFVEDLNTGVTTKIVTEGDPAPGGGRIGLAFSNDYFFLNSSGQVVFEALTNGFLGSTASIFTGSPTSPLTKVVADGDPAPIAGTTFVFPQLNFNGTPTPSVLNEVGQIAFWSQLSNRQEGMFLYSPGSPIAKVAVSGDVVAGATLQFLGYDSGNSEWALNALGQVAFAADTTTGTTFGNGVYVGTATGLTQKVAATGDPLAGGTISFTTGVLSFNDSGALAFQAGVNIAATTSYGYFLGSGGSIQTLALDGQAAPAGGNFSTGSSLYFPGLAQVNNKGDVVFQSRLTGGSATSGLFRRLSGGTLQAIVLQGQAVPGGLGVFGEIPTATNNYFGSALFSLGPDGTVAFSNSYQNGAASPVRGAFRVPPNGIMSKIIVPGDPVPGTGGGTLSEVSVVLAPDTSGNLSGGFGLWAGASGGNTQGALTLSFEFPAGTNSTSTTLVSAQNPSGIGEPATFTATVAKTSTFAGTPAGTVVFLDAGVSLVGSTLVNGVATFSDPTLTTGSHSITAQYVGDANFAPSTSATLTQSVSNATTTLLFASPAPSVGGQSVKFQAIVSSSVSAVFVPTGTVTFFDGSSQIGAGTLVSGSATLSTSSLTTGTHSITAQYSGDASFAGNTSNVLTQVVQATSLLPSAAALASSGNPSFAGQAVTFTANVNGQSGGGTPTGNVNFLDNGAMIGTSALNAGVATFTTSSLSVGSHPVTAVYAGDANFSGSTSNVVTQTVNPTSVPTAAPTFIAVNSSPNPSAVGQSVLFTATVSSSATGTLTGSVTFLDNGTRISGSTTPLTSGGTASYSTSSLSAGSHPITAQYLDNANNFASSMSSVLSQTVGSSSTPTVTVQITPIPTHVAPRSTCPAGGYCEQFAATVQNGGTAPVVTWQVLNGPGNIDSTGNFTALPSVAQGLVTISATVGNSSASVSFVLGPDALTTSQTPATVAAGTPLSVPVQLSGVPPASTVPFILSCGSLPAATTCQFSNNSTTPPNCPMGTITFVTGQCPNFTVNVITTGGTAGTAAQLAPVPIEPGRPFYALFAVILPILALAGRRRAMFFGRRSYTCCVLLLLCLSVVFLGSCSVFPTTSTATAPVTKAITPSGLYQVVVTATPGPNSANFVQTQLIVPITIN